jgi:hypothetical protein
LPLKSAHERRDEARRLISARVDPSAKRKAERAACSDTFGWHPDLIELQLAHAERNKVRAAYNRATRLGERRKHLGYRPSKWAGYSYLYPQR